MKRLSTWDPRLGVYRRYWIRGYARISRSFNLGDWELWWGNSGEG